MPDLYSPASPLPRNRGVFCNRTLNFRSLRAIGYDMDYTLVDYRMEAFELQVFEFARERLLAEGWAVESLVFDPGMVARGLVIDTEQGNVVRPTASGWCAGPCTALSRWTSPASGRSTPGPWWISRSRAGCS